MARVCQLTGKKVLYGHNVAHSNVKTNRRFEPNLQRATLYSDVLGRKLPLRVSTRALRSVQKNGGIDSFLLKMDDAKLAEEGLRLKRLIKKALARASRPKSAATA